MRYDYNPVDDRPEYGDHPHDIEAQEEALEAERRYHDELAEAEWWAEHRPGDQELERMARAMCCEYTTLPTPRK